MNGNGESPWNPEASPAISATEFEEVVLKWLELAAKRNQQAITTQHLGVVQGNGGEYRIDVRVTFCAFDGASFLVLVECKHQRRPVEREDVMILEAKLRDVNAQKAMLFSTSGFQSGALQFAKAKNIAMVRLVDGRLTYETRAAGNRVANLPDWVEIEAIVGHRIIGESEYSERHELVDSRHLEPIAGWLAEPVPEPGGRT